MGLSGDVTSLVLVVFSLNTLKLATGAVTVNLTITPSSQVQPGATVYLNCEVWTNDTFGAFPTLLQQNGSKVPAPISKRQIDDSTILYYKRIENVMTSTCYTCKAEEWFGTAPPATMNACVDVTTTVDQSAVAVNLTITPSSQVHSCATVYLNCEVWTNDTFGAFPTLLQQEGSEVPGPMLKRRIDDSTILYYKRIENVVTSTCYTCKAEVWFGTAPPATMNACVNITTTVDQIHVISNDSKIILDLNGSDDYSFTVNLTVSVEDFEAVEEDLSVTAVFSPQSGVRLSVLEYYTKTHTDHELTIHRLNGTVYVYSLNINLVSLVDKLKGSFQETLIWTLSCHNTSKVHKYTVVVIPDENVVKAHYARTSRSEGLHWTPLEVLMLVLSFVFFIIFIAAGIVTLVLLVKLRNYRRRYLQNLHQQFPEERSKENTWKKLPRVQMCYSCFCTVCRKEHSTHGDTVELQDVTNDSCTL